MIESWQSVFGGGAYVDPSRPPVGVGRGPVATMNLC